ncbi:MAG: hypothetical protein NVS4B11_08640 [Ktedonobacteraceae bacterium]
MTVAQISIVDEQEAFHQIAVYQMAYCLTVDSALYGVFEVLEEFPVQAT